MAGQGSARVKLREIDLSQVRNPQQAPIGVPAAVVGAARKGPAFVPRTFANMQQFNEVFGSMLEVGRESNSNLLGPLAINEWMKNSQAGTFLRILGVGNGLPASGGKTTDAGFIVGEKQVQKQPSDTGKLGDNPHANITNSTEAIGTGRTHFLGCFMKDVTNSNFLKDAGMEAAGAAASLIINATEKPSADDTFILNVIEEDSGASGNKTVTFTATGGGVNEVDLRGTVKDVFDDFRTKVLALADSDGGTLNDHLTIVVEQGSTENNDSAKVTITSKHSSLLDATNASVASFNLNPTISHLNITVGDKTASQASQFVQFGSSGNTAAKFELKRKSGTTGNVAANELVTFSLINNDGDATLSDKSVQYIFKAASDIIVGNANGNDARNLVEGKFLVSAAGVVHVQIGSTLLESLRNLKSAIDHVAPAGGVSTNHEGLSTTSFDSQNTKLTVFQKNLGEDGNAEHDDTANINAFTLANVTLVNAASQADAVASTTRESDKTDFAASYFFGGTDSNENKNLTIRFTGNAVVDDRIELSVQENNDLDDTRTLHLLFKAESNTGNGETATPRHVAIGDDLQETLYNLKNAIADDQNKHASASVHDDVTVEVSDANDSLTITYVNNGARNLTKTAQGGAQGGLRGDVQSEVSIGDYATFSNTSGFLVTGNFGQKSINFSGAGGAAAPVIRGVLMTPQGVRATLDVADGLSDDGSNILVASKDATNSQIREAAHGKSFGNTAGTHLTGYTVGNVSASDQGFKLILNGYSNAQNAAVLNCSFNPDSDSYFAKVLNTDPSKIEELGHYLYASWDVKPGVAIPSNSGLLHAGVALSGNYERMIGFLVAGEGNTGRRSDAAGKPDYEDFSSKFQTAKTPWIVSQFYSSSGDSAARPLTAALGEAKKLFRLHVLDDGVVGNSKYRLLVSNLSYAGSNSYGSFDLALERFDSNPIKGDVVASWSNANLDPSSRNFIGRLIGSIHEYYDFEVEESRQRLRSEGIYPLKNEFVRIELSDELKQDLLPPDALPAGFQGHSHLHTKTNGNFLEPTDIAQANRVFTDASNTVTETLSQAQVTPLDFVKSINRQLVYRSTGSVFEADSDLAWGVKFSERDSAESGEHGHKELLEQVFNKSILSWTKFFPSFGGNPAWITTDSADSNQNNFFSLEKILIPSSSLSSDAISTWDGALYKRASHTPSSGERFVNISKDAISSNSRFLKFRCMFQGGFDGVNIFDKEKSEFTGTASLREGLDETSSQKFTGPTIMSYRRAVDVLSDKSAAEFQLLVIPGQRSSKISDYAISACEDRFDAMLVMDIVQKDSQGRFIEDSEVRPHVRNTISEFKNRALDTSFAAAYFPDVLMRRPSDNAEIIVPPSVGMIGVMSRNDSIADPWFAPAGLRRGRLSAIDSQVQMNRDLLDELYDEDINPIYVPAGRSGEVYAFGQKTLLQDASALDRINVRRLLIDIRRKVKKIGEQLLFEPNRASTLSRFSALVEPIMASVQQRGGVERYKVQIDTTTTTQNDIENNTIRGKIYLQPTKSIEFISLDFVVANNI
tara:strand:+ start:10252 stop:14868 length:4617 start_codon:yes stop_codon:yes gene_type:complete